MIQMVNMGPIELRPIFQSNKMSRTKPNSPDNNEEVEDGWTKRELDEALSTMNSIRESDLESDKDDDDRNMEDVSIVEEIPS